MDPGSAGLCEFANEFFESRTKPDAGGGAVAFRPRRTIGRIAMKKWLLLLGGIIIVGGAAYYGWSQRHKKRGDRTVQTVQARLGSFEDSVEATGEVEPLNRVEIKPTIPGRIEQLLVDKGSRVKAGQLLAWMSSSDRASILDAALAKGPDEYKRWQDSYKPTPVVAPLSGTIILRNVVVGQT